MTDSPQASPGISPADFDAEDAALRDHRREANKATRYFLLAAGSFALMFIVLIGAVAISMNRGKTPLAPSAAPVAVAAAPAVSDKDAEIARLRNEILALQTQSGQGAPVSGPVYSADPAALAQLSARLDRIEASQRVLARAAAAANAATTLQQASRGDAPFLSQLAIVEATVDDPAAIALLRPYAEKGVPSEVSLAVEFPGVAARANIAAKRMSGGDSLVAKVLHAMNFISVRHIDAIDGDGPEAILQRAETRLNVGDLHGAVGYLVKLPPEAQAAIKPWMGRAQARLSVDDATQRLTEGALTRLSQSGDVAVQPAGGAL